MKIIKDTYIDNLPNFTPYYIYKIIVDHNEVGTLIVREGDESKHIYDGHIGYTINKEFRGNHYAYKACLLLKEELINMGYNSVIITCSPDNIASKKTIEKLQADYLYTKEIPKHLRKYYTKGEKEKDIFRWRLI